MSRLKTIRPEFVEFVPKELEDGVLYVSIPYNTAVHRCACGCGNKITTPIRPGRWRFAYDGEAISLSPSVGNWSYPCQSHYVIERNNIRWAAKWSRERIERGRSRDRAARQARYLSGSGGDTAADVTPADPQATSASRGRRWIRRIFKRSG